MSVLLNAGLNGSSATARLFDVALRAYGVKR